MLSFTWPERGLWIWLTILITTRPITGGKIYGKQPEAKIHAIGQYSRTTQVASRALLSVLIEAGFIAPKSGLKAD